MFWDDQVVVTKAGRYYGRLFRTEIGLTQVVPVYPTFFNILVYAVVRVVIIEVCVPQYSLHVLGWLSGGHNIVFYAYGGRIAGCNSIWVQMTLMVVVQLFKRVGLQTNMGKTIVVVFTLGFI